MPWAGAWDRSQGSCALVTAWTSPIEWSAMSTAAREGCRRAWPTSGGRTPLRIVAGQWRGRRLHPPRDRRVRPTPDRVREAWMSILGNEILGARVIDLFAGSGALGLEALSRGAASAEFVELTPQGVDLIRKNADELGAGTEVVVRRADAIRHAAALAEGSFDIA